jgi:hypothetical protein
MTRDDSEWVNGLFGASAADRTPAPASHAARVLYAPVSRDPEASWRCVSVLSDIELQRADRFVTEDGKAHSNNGVRFVAIADPSCSDHRGPYRR